MIVLNRKKIFLGLLLLSSILSGCRPSRSQDIQAQPIGNYKVGLNTLELKIDTPLTDSTLDIEGNMNMPGMTPTRGIAKRILPGLYRAQNFKFDMAGDWILTLRANEPGRLLTSEIPLLVK